MKIKNNLYQCPWCLETISHQKETSEGESKRRVSSTLLCQICGNKVSQRSKEGYK